MKIPRILILAAAAWAGTWIYKLQYVPSDADNEKSGGHSSRSMYSTITGSGSLGQTLRSSTSSRSSQPPIGGTSGKKGGKASPAIEDMAPDDVDLLQAAAKGDKNLVERRISMHVKMDSRDTYRRTPLMYASWNGNDDIANRLIAAGANPELKDVQGNNSFDYAASRGLVDTLHFMLERTHTPDDHHYMEYAYVMQAVYSGDPARLPEGNGRLASVNHINPEGQAPLHMAAGNGSVALMQALIHCGADVNIVNDGRQTPLHWAAWNNQPQAVQLLVSLGGDITATDYAGNTPLLLAAQNGSYQAAQVLLSRGADKYVSNKEGKTASIVAEDKGYNALANLLK